MSAMPGSDTALDVHTLPRFKIDEFVSHDIATTDNRIRLNVPDAQTLLAE